VGTCSSEFEAVNRDILSFTPVFKYLSCSSKEKNGIVKMATDRYYDNPTCDDKKSYKRSNTADECIRETPYQSYKIVCASPSLATISVSCLFLAAVLLFAQ
jgi:hypothetical protein